VLSLVAEGLSNKAIAGRLFVTERTVEAHVKQIFLKLHLNANPESPAACSPCSPTCGRRCRRLVDRLALVQVARRSSRNRVIGQAP
jgi:DNA-binding NarL/FixJ family response regulator